VTANKCDSLLKATGLFGFTVDNSDNSTCFTQICAENYLGRKSNSLWTGKNRIRLLLDEGHSVAGWGIGGSVELLVHSFGQWVAATAVLLVPVNMPLWIVNLCCSGFPVSGVMIGPPTYKNTAVYFRLFLSLDIKYNFFQSSPVWCTIFRLVVERKFSY